MSDVCPDCGSADFGRINCMAGNLKRCRKCGETWNYDESFKITPFKKPNDDKLVL